MYTVVQNPTDRTITYSFLRKHGATLAPDETLSIEGNLIEQLAKLPRLRKFEALKKCLDDETLTIVSLPVPDGV